MRSLGVLLLLLSGAWAWLTRWDRMSAPAISLVEVETGLGFSPVVWLGLAGIALLAFSLRPAKKPLPPLSLPDRPLSVSAIVDLATIPLEPGAHIEQSRHTQDSFPTLVVTRAPPERVRRALDQLFQAIAPQPPVRVRVRLVGCPSTGIPWNVLVLGMARRYLPESAGFRVAVTLLDGVEPEVEVRIFRENG